VRLDGLHHISAITADAPTNVEFYAGVLGLRLVKKSVNQDDPSVYHLFYGDDEASFGADLTFFEYPGLPRGRAGAGMVHRILWRVGSEAALDYWRARLADVGGVESTRTEHGLLFADPEGLEHELVVRDDAPDAPLAATGAGVPPEHALLGFEGVRAYRDVDAARELFEDTLGFVPVEGGHEVRGATRGGVVLSDPAPAERPLQGAGTVHHVAFAMETDDAGAWQQRVSAGGAHATPVVERFWFRSVYFREPAGVLFELATKGPGFAVDEDAEHLGEQLVLPPTLEPLRDRIEPVLTPLPDAAALWRGAPAPR
jgi:glyoxalase family protein